MGLGDAARPEKWAGLPPSALRGPCSSSLQPLCSLSPTLHLHLTPLAQLVVSLTA